MGRRFVGEFNPPRELVAISAPRVGGRGTIEVSPSGLTFEGTVLGVQPAIPPWASLVVLAAALLVNALVPHAERVLFPATVLVVLGILWLRYRAEFGLTGPVQVSWAAVEHVVRLPSAPDVLAFVLSHPLRGRSGPEQVFFAATEGLHPLVEALREHAPPTLQVDLESADRAEHDGESGSPEGDPDEP